MASTPDISPTHIGDILQPTPPTPGSILRLSQQRQTPGLLLRGCPYRPSSDKPAAVPKAFFWGERHLILYLAHPGHTWGLNATSLVTALLPSVGQHTATEDQPSKYRLSALHGQIQPTTHLFRKSSTVGLFISSI